MATPTIRTEAASLAPVTTQRSSKLWRTELERVVDRALALRAAGWRVIRIVTDHGWLLMPGGFTSVKLPSSVTETNWSRAAVLSDGAAAELPWLPWYWDATVRIAVPPGAEAYRAGDVYSHGGLSPQESVTPDITVGGSGATASSAAARIVGVNWRRLRLVVDLAGDLSGYSIEVRRAPRDAASRLGEPATIDGSKAKYTMSDEIDEGEPVHVVLSIGTAASQTPRRQPSENEYEFGVGSAGPPRRASVRRLRRA
jgi:hypothetical protein